MTTKEFNLLGIGDKVVHKRYGLSTVNDFLPEFGPVIIPDTEEGKKILAFDSGVVDTPFLEDSPRRLKKP
jgi:hypothetical protein